MSITIIPATKDNLALIEGHKFKPVDGDGVVYVKLVMIKPETLTESRTEQVLEENSGFLVIGNLDEIKSQLPVWFSQTAEAYKNE